MADSVHHAILTAAQTALRALDLTGLEDDSIVLLSTPADSLKYLPIRTTESALLPAILVSPFGVEQLSQTEGTNVSDDIGYPVHIAILDSHKQDQQTDLEQWLEWRELAIDQFVHNRLTITTSRGGKLIDQFVELGQVVDPTAWRQRSIFASTLTVRVKFRRPRRP